MNKDNNYSYTPLPEPIPITEQHWPEGTVPIVTTRTITYMHEPFISECIEGILMQKTTFPVEVVIHDDASTDKTAEIVREYQAKHPRLIKAICQKENQFSKPGKGTLRKDIQDATRGKYIALCEGDDYWTDPLKLQKQVEFLEANEEYAMCFHKVKIQKQDGEIVDDFITNIPVNHESILDLARHGNYIHTPSTLFRNLITNYPPEFSKSPIGDYPLYMYLSQFGRIKYHVEIMAVYRHGVGVWSNHDQYFRRYNTAISHAILFQYFRLIDNTEISNVFSNRILNFLMMYAKEMPNEDFDELLKYPALGRIIIKQQLSDLSNLKPKLINNASIKTLFRALLKKMKSRLVK
jgi:glycosyltransferase involved in cell wall biosynthesis